MLKTIHSTNRLRFIARVIALGGATIAICYVCVLVTLVRAVPATDFKAGRIIDDSVFTNKSSMNVSQIQSFLNSKVPTCDTNGTQLSEYGGADLNGDGKVQRWEWGQAKYSQSTFVCLRDYVENGKSSAQIIYDIAQQFTINPQVLIVLLQKEQGLVQDTWPLNAQYRSATGYGCPDTAPCDSQYYGLTNQVKWAATMFRAISNASSTWYTPYVTGNNYIQYNPSSTCGGGTVNIENRATQALYNYTPYQPNQGAIAAGWGTADCGAYGNRNFYLYFTEWFGNTVGPDNFWELQALNIFSNPELTIPVRTNGSEVFLAPGQKAYVQVVAKNTGRTTWQRSTTRLGTYSPIDYSSPFVNESWLASYRIGGAREASVAPYQSATFDFNITAPSSPSYYIEKYNMVTEGVTWFNDANLRLYITVQTPETSPATLANKFEVGKKLNKGEALVSANNKTVLKLQNNGNLELFTNFNKTWSSNTYNSGATQLILQGDGNMVLYSPTAAVWSSNTYNSGATQLILQGDGNMVLYSPTAAVWSSNTSIQDQTGLVNRKLANGLSLYPGQSLTTPDRKYKLVLQSDGSLVIYSPQKAIWDSRTFGKNPGSLTMQTDGNLVLTDTLGNPIWSSSTGGNSPSELLLQQDGNLVIYTQTNATATWSSGTVNK